MKYSEDFIKCVIGTIAHGCSIREASRILGIARSTVARRVTRIRYGSPARFTRVAKRVWNRTSKQHLMHARILLDSGKYEISEDRCETISGYDTKPTVTQTI